MTSDEKQELEILIFLRDAGIMNKGTFGKELLKYVGLNASSYKMELLRKHYIQESFSETNVHRFFEDLIGISPLGIKRIDYLTRKERYDKILAVAFWILFAAAIVSAIYAVLTYYQTNDVPTEKILQKEKSIIPLKQKVKQIPKSDSTMGRKKDS